MKIRALKFAIVTFLILTVVLKLRAQSPTTNPSADSAGKTVAFISEPIILETPPAALYGTLLRPNLSYPVPVVLIIAGSGPTDRDGNSPMLSGPNNSLKMLAEGLAKQGIASVRYDKRGIGESGRAMLAAAEKAKVTLREEDLRFDSYIDDAVLWGKKLLADRRFSSVTIAGHSEGSLIGMVAAQRIRVSSFVSIAGDGRPPQQLLTAQFKAQLPPELLKPATDIVDQLAVGKRVDSVPAALNPVFRPSVQPYMISWLHYDPIKEIKVLSLPILIIQGTTDVQVGDEDAKLLVSANPKAKLLLIDGMNHVLKVVPREMDKQTASYSDPSLPVDARLVDGINAFVVEAKPQRNQH